MVKCRDLSRVFKTANPLFCSLEILQDIGELFLPEDGCDDFAKLCENLKELVKANIGLQPCIAAFKTLAIIFRSHCKNFEIALNGVVSHLRHLDRAMSCEVTAQPFCSIRQTIAFESFRLASSFLYCHSFCDEDDRRSFQSIQRLLNSCLFSHRLSKVIGATLFDLPKALLEVAELFFRNDVIVACGIYAEKAEQLLEKRLSLEQLMAKTVIGASKELDTESKAHLVDILEDLFQVLAKSKNVSEVVRLLSSESKPLDEVMIREALVDIDWYGFTASGFFSFISTSTVSDAFLTLPQCLNASRKAANHLQHITSYGISLLPHMWKSQFAKIISRFVSNLILCSKSGNCCLEAVVHIFDNMPLSSNCRSQSFDLAFSITKHLLRIGDLNIAKDQWAFAEKILSLCQKASSLDAALLNIMCSKDLSQAEKNFLNTLKSCYSELELDSMERSWTHFKAFLRKFTEFTSDSSLSNAISSIAKVCSVVFMEEADVRKKCLFVLDAVFHCARELECTLDDQRLLEDIQKYFSLFCQTHWQLLVCPQAQEAVETVMQHEEVEIESGIMAVADLADCLGLIENRKRQDQYNALISKFYHLCLSSQWTSSEVVSLCEAAISFAINVETTTVVEPRDITLLLKFLHRCWRITKEERFADNWEMYVLYSIGAILTWLNSPLSSRRHLAKPKPKQKPHLPSDEEITSEQFIPEWHCSKDTEFILGLPEKDTCARCISTESDCSIKETPCKER